MDDEHSRTGDAVLEWLSGIDHEVSYWKTVIGDEMRDVSKQHVLNQNKPRQFEYYCCVSPGDKVLDVGSGPFSFLGDLLPDGGMVELHATDPLAPVYAALHEINGIVPRAKPQFCFAENLSRKYAKNSFKVVHARNSLDHSFNPMRALRNMLFVCDIHGTVVLRHAENEGEHGGYGGLHQWNFKNENDRLILWNTGIRIDVGAEFGEYARIECVTEKNGERDWCLAKIEKLKDFDIESNATLEFEETAYSVLYGKLLSCENSTYFNNCSYRKYLPQDKSVPSLYDRYRKKRRDFFKALRRSLKRVFHRDG